MEILGEASVNIYELAPSRSNKVLTTALAGTLKITKDLCRNKQTATREPDFRSESRNELVREIGLKGARIREFE